MNKKTVNVVVVTYNRLELLKRCVSALVNQSYPISKIFIINNASNDGTTEWLSTINKEIIIPINLEKNTGGAGGFSKGMELAIEDACDFVWLMDDDGQPSSNCLDTLINKKISNRILNPLVVNENDERKLSFRLGSFTTVEQAKNSCINDLILGVGNPFNGTLIPTSIIEDIGLPKKEMFIWGDEEEYVLRAKNRGYDIITCVDAIHYHPKEKSNKIKVVGGLLGEVNIKPSNMIDIYLRNQFYNAIKYSKWKKFLITFVKYFVFSLQSRDFKLMKTIFSSVYKALYL